MVHPQPYALIQMEKSTMNGITNNKVHQKRRNVMYMHFYCVEDRFWEGHYNTFWNLEQIIWITISPNIIELIIIDIFVQCIYTVKKIKRMQVIGCVIQSITSTISTTESRLKQGNEAPLKTTNIRTHGKKDGQTYGPMVGNSSQQINLREVPTTIHLSLIKIFQG